MNKIQIVREKIEVISVNAVIENDERIIFCEDEVLKLSVDDSKKSLCFVLKPNINVNLYIIGNDTKLDICYHLAENSVLNVYAMNCNCSDSVCIYLEGDGASVNYHNSFLNICDNCYHIKVMHQVPRTFCKLYLHGVNKDHKRFEMIVDGVIPRNCIGCSHEQDNQIINLTSAISLIRPNLFIDTHDVVASHSAYIGQFQKDVLFFLESRGIDRLTCYQLLTKGFLLGKMDLGYQERDEFLRMIEQVGGEEFEQRRF